MMGGGPPSFKTAPQSATTQSTMEAEIISMVFASKEAVYLSNMMTEMRDSENYSTVYPLFDNTSDLHIAGNSTYSSRTRHIALRFFFLSELIREKRITIHHVATTKQLTGIRPKFLSKSTHRHLVELKKYTKTNEEQKKGRK